MKRLIAVFRLFLAAAVLCLFTFAIISPFLASNFLLAPLFNMQFSAALYGTASFAAVLIALSMLFGRIFCSVLCPLGTAAELIWRMRRVFLPSKNKTRGKVLSLFRAAYIKPPKLRYIVPLITGLGLMLLFFPLMMLFDPISTFGRGMNAVRTALNGDITGFAFCLAIPFALIIVIAFFRGRAFCDWCPVGLTLGLFSRDALFAMRLNPDCVSCGICESQCPAGCISSKEKKLDGDRCVLCFSCAAVCPKGSVRYGRPDKTSGVQRSIFLKGAGKLAAAGAIAYILGPFGKFFYKKASVMRYDGILPPGAKNASNFFSRCIGCYACAASCPSGVIKTQSASQQQRLQPHPVVDYTDAGCQFNCTECGKVCPTGAIRRLSVDEKHRTRVALTALNFERCIVNTKREACGACAEVCPTGAITMAAFTESGVAFLTKPMLEARYCIGCGACYAACPAMPRAISLAAAPEQTLTEGTRPPAASGDELQIDVFEEFPF